MIFPRSPIPQKHTADAVIILEWSSFTLRKPLHNLHSQNFLPSTPHKSANKSSSSSSHPPFLLLTTIFSSSFVSATAFNSSFSCVSVTFDRNCPLRANMISLFSTSCARDSLTRRIRPRRSAASGSRIWLRMLWRASAGWLLDLEVGSRKEGEGISTFLLSARYIQSVYVLYIVKKWFGIRTAFVLVLLHCFHLHLHPHHPGLSAARDEPF